VTLDPLCRRIFNGATLPLESIDDESAVRSAFPDDLQRRAYRRVCSEHAQRFCGRSEGVAGDGASSLQFLDAGGKVLNELTPTSKQ
jgi:hypothetical protein